MFLIKIVASWFIVGCIVFMLVTAWAWAVTKSYGKKFDMSWGLKSTICSIITWPHYANDIITAIKKAKKLWKS